MMGIRRSVVFYSDSFSSVAQYVYAMFLTIRVPNLGTVFHMHIEIEKLIINIRYLEYVRGPPREITNAL